MEIKLSERERWNGDTNCKTQDCAIRKCKQAVSFIQAINKHFMVYNLTD